MATERFFRLPQEKQYAILRAAIKEFAQVPMDKVSINKIIQDADISRGSFYTYFEDKTDILNYIFRDGQRHFKEFCTQALKRHNGDLWMMLEDFFACVITYCFQGEMADFFRNVMAGSKADEFLRGFGRELGINEESQKMERWIFDNMDKSDLRLQTYEEFHRFLEVVLSVTMITMKDYQNGQKTEDEIKTEYHRKLQMLRYGVCR